MTLNMYAIKDELNGFTCPIPLNNDKIAARYLKDQYDTNPTVKGSPEHFSIWKVGEYDSETGFFEAKTPELKGEARAYVSED